MMIMNVSQSMDWRLGVRNFGELQCTVYRRTNLSPTSSFPLPQIPIHHNDSSLNFLFSPPTPHPQFKNRKFGVNGITDDGIDLWCHPSHLIIGVIYCCIHGKLYTHTHTYTHTHIYIYIHAYAERERCRFSALIFTYKILDMCLFLPVLTKRDRQAGTAQINNVTACSPLTSLQKWRTTEYQITQFYDTVNEMDTS